MLNRRIGKCLSVLVMGGSMLLGGVMISQNVMAQGKKTMEGTVSDAMCGANHNGKDAAKCTMGCVKKGSKYALVVGDKVYTLEGKTDGLDKLAGAKAKVTGTVSGDTITVDSVQSAS